MSAGEALDLALGLLRAPARRGLLVTRPLPSGMTTLLSVAGGSSNAARDASEATGATPDELLEASRFFVQQVLFHEGADAYRILGVPPDAPQARLLTHHRLLQRWLHPDRDGGEAWDSAFSARVNEAWNRVRTPQARRAYDAELAASAPAYAARAAAGPATGHGHTGLVPAHHVPPPPSATRSVLGPLAVIAVTLACIGLLWVLQHRPAPAEDFYPARPVAPTQASAPPQAPAHPAEAGAPDPAGNAAGETGGSLAVLARLQLPSTSAPVSVPAEPGATAADAETTAAEPAARDTSGVVQDTGPGEPPPPGIPAGSTKLPAASGGLGAVAATSDTGRSANPDPPQQADAAPIAEAADLLQLLEQAEATVAQATLYLASDGSRVPPIWNDFPTEVIAAQARVALAERLDGAGVAPVELMRPQWRMDTHRAGVEAGYRAAGRHGGEEGRLRVEMTRREERWLITHFALEPLR